MSRAIVRKEGATARWDVKPVQRSLRRLDERLLLAPPWLARALWPAVARAHPGSFLRRGLGRLLRAGIEANNRCDYEAISRFMSPDIELHLYPDAPQLRAIDIEPICHGPHGYVKALELLKAEFGSFRWELQELFDPGGARFAARTEIVAHGGLSGVEVRRTDFNVWQFEHGLLRRQYVFSNEATMFAMLDTPQTAPR